MISKSGKAEAAAVVVVKEGVVLLADPRPPVVLPAALHLVRRGGRQGHLDHLEVLVRPQAQDLARVLVHLAHQVHHPHLLASGMFSSLHTSDVTSSDVVHFSPSSNLGGQTRSGSGVKPAFGGGRYYPGGAAVPYTAGRRSGVGIAPFLLPVALLSVFPGVWLYSAYAYPYNNPYHYRGNRTAANHTARAIDDTGDSTVNVTCLCQQYSVCGCDDNNNNTLIADMMNISDGAPPQNSSLVKVVDFANGTTQLYINGTLPNGTTAPGGTDPSDASQVSFATTEFAKLSGYWVMVATVVAAVTML